MFNFLMLMLSCTLLRAEEVHFINGNILPDFEINASPVSELLVKDGKVLKTGNKLGTNPGVQQVDLKGQWVIPALTDAHAHLLATGEETRKLNLKNRTLEETLDIITSALKTSPTPNCVTGFGWDQTLWPQKQFPNRKLLDELSGKIPIILFRVDGHAAWANTLALKKSGLWDSPVTQFKEQIPRDREGLPSGIILDAALKPLEDIIPPASKNEVQGDIRRFVKQALRLGITSIHDAGIKEKDLTILKDLIQTEDLPFRFYEMLDASDPSALKEQLKRGPLINSINGRLTARTVKLFLDGAMGSRGALFSEPYLDDSNTRGIQLISETNLEAQIRQISEAGFQVAIHAIGSQANHIALNTFEKIKTKGLHLKRPRLEHAQVLIANDIKRAGRLGVIASMQPIHCTSDSRWIIERIGSERARYAYPWRSFLNENVTLAFGSDSPIESLNPWPALFAATQRKRSHLDSDPSFFPEEKISIREALFAYTSGAAFGAFQEKMLGSLHPGKWADFIVLEKNPLLVSPIELQQVQVRATYFAGRKVFDLKSSSTN